MSAARFDIFDCHQHIGGVFGVPETSGNALTTSDALVADRDLRLQVMDRCGVRQALLMPGHSYLKPGGIASTRAINDQLAAYRALQPNRFPVAIGVSEPRQGVAAIGEIDRMHFELGFQGVSWHHRQQGLPMDHPVMFDCLRRMDELNLIPLIHCYVSADFEDLWRLRRLAERFPRLPFLCLDAMTHAEQLEQVLSIGERVSNILIDTTSSVLGPDGVRKAVDRLGPERLLFGTNLYSRQSPQRMDELDFVLDSGLPAEALEQILGGNARRVFGLETATLLPG